MSAQNMVDIHNHLLYGVDDGPKVREDTLTMLRDARKEGITTIYATPHSYPGLRPFDYEKYLEKVAEINSWCSENISDMTILTGSEVRYTQNACSFLRNGRIPSLNNTPYVLLEFSVNVKYDELKEGLLNIARSGFQPVLAHCERYKVLSAHPKKTLKLSSEIEMCFQMNASSVTENNGITVNRFVKFMLSNELIDFIASDAHDPTFRPIELKDAFDTIAEKYGRNYAVSVTGGIDY